MPCSIKKNSLEKWPIIKPNAYRLCAWKRLLVEFPTRWKLQESDIIKIKAKVEDNFANTFMYKFPPNWNKAKKYSEQFQYSVDFPFSGYLYRGTVKYPWRNEVLPWAKRPPTLSVRLVMGWFLLLVVYFTNENDPLCKLPSCLTAWFLYHQASVIVRM